MPEPLPSNFTMHAPLVLASKQVTGPERRPVCFAFRLDPNNKADSGWVFWSGEEDQHYIDDDSNTIVCPLLSFLETDASLWQIVQKPVRTAWERERPGDAWREVPDYF